MEGGVLMGAIYGLGERLRESRDRIKLSQQAVASALGVDSSTISRQERNEEVPNTQVLTKLASLYGVSTDYLLGLSGRRMIDISGLSEEQIKWFELTLEMLKKGNHE